ncbi:MAG: hypothetical protein IJW97_01995 [Clostridia bacterium]|nr:hypothetical protein [Clostridia bacterium]
MDINSELLALQREWERQVVEPIMECNDPAHLSRPYCMGLSEEYLTSDRRIMIVGQETKGWGTYTDDWPAPMIQSWSIGYLRRQLWGIGADEYNRSPFWRLFRLLDRAGLVPCWNNIDKLQRPIDGKTVRLTREQETQLCCRYGEEQQSLIEREIALCRPDVILFATGPQYCYPMACSFGVEEGELWRYRPTKERLLVDVTAVLGLHVPAFWTYHPAYLSRKGQLLAVTERLIEQAEKIPYPS